MATETKQQTMNPVEMLTQDHDRVKDLFRQFKEAGDKAYKTKQNLAEKIFMELEIHSALEEEMFYPALQAKTDKEGTELVSEGIEEHHVVDLIIAELKAMDPTHEQYDAKMTVLCENVQHHIEEEEEEMFVDARKQLGGDELESLGTAMSERKKALMGEMR